MIIHVCSGQEQHTIPKLILTGMVSIKVGNSMVDISNYPDVEIESDQPVGANGSKGSWKIFKAVIPIDTLIRLKCMKNTLHEQYLGECWFKANAHCDPLRYYAPLAMHQERGGWIYGNVEYIKGCKYKSEEVPLVD